MTLWDRRSIRDLCGLLIFTKYIFTYAFLYILTLPIAHEIPSMLEMMKRLLKDLTISHIFEFLFSICQVGFIYNNSVFTCAPIGVLEILLSFPFISALDVKKANLICNLTLKLPKLYQ